MFNVYNEAQHFTQVLNPAVDIKFICLPQTQEWHTEEPDPNAGVVTYNLKGTVQTVGTATDILTNTLNSPRLFKIYISHNEEILSLIQMIPREVIAEFIYQNQGIQARIDSFNDYRYNGWVCFTASQCVPKHYTQHGYNGGTGWGHNQGGGYSGGGHPNGGFLGYE